MKLNYKKVLEKIELQEQKIKDLKSNKIQKKDIKIELEQEKNNADFLRSDL